MSITVQSISLSVTVSILPRASPTSVSVKLLTPCQQWRRAYLDPVDGWVLVDLSQANIFSESAERGPARVCQPLHPLTHTRLSTFKSTSSGNAVRLSPSPTDTRSLQFRTKWEELCPQRLRENRFKIFFSVVLFLMVVLTHVLCIDPLHFFVKF